MTDHWDILVLGGGAAGLAAGIFAGEIDKERGVRIAVVDGAEKIGAKILVSGGGRCNVTHEKVLSEDYHGSRNVIRNILRGFDERQTVAWFESMGIKLKREETGKLFPVTDKASTVLNALLRRCRELDICVVTGKRVTNIYVEDDLFVLDTDRERMVASRLVLATGGRSLPKTGSDGSGWRMVKTLGHTVTPTYAALAPLVLDETMFHAACSGISMHVQLTARVDGKEVDRRDGSLLFTHFGVSGPVVMDASRFVTMRQDDETPVELLCSFLPGETYESINEYLIEAGRLSGGKTLVSYVSERMPRRVAECLVEHIGIDGGVEMSRLSKDGRRRVVRGLTELKLPVVRHRGWNYAEVTAGGVPMDEVNQKTMESRVRPGLYLVGEMLDVDGRIGGFNFQWAWATGWRAGRAAVKSLKG